MFLDQQSFLSSNYYCSVSLRAMFEASPTFMSTCHFYTEHKCCCRTNKRWSRNTSYLAKRRSPTSKHSLPKSLQRKSDSGLDGYVLYLIVYRMVPFFMIRKSLFGAVMLWATDLLPFLKNVSGVQTLVTIRLFSRRISTGPSYFNRLSTHVWRKNTSMVYSWKKAQIQSSQNCTQINQTFFRQCASLEWFCRKHLLN